MTVCPNCGQDPCGVLARCAPMTNDEQWINTTALAMIPDSIDGAAGYRRDIRAALQEAIERGKAEQDKAVAKIKHKTCDYPGCKRRVSSTIPYACGAIIGEDKHSCGGYFCPDHLTYVTTTGHGILCPSCGKLYDILARLDNPDEALVEAFLASHPVIGLDARDARQLIRVLAQALKSGK